jgi:hypothetical protein
MSHAFGDQPVAQRLQLVEKRGEAADLLLAAVAAVGTAHAGDQDLLADIQRRAALMDDLHRTDLLGLGR